MHILHLGKFYFPFVGGIENVLRDLAQAQAGLGHEVRILAHQHQPWRLTTKELDHGVRLTRCFSMGRLVYAPLAPTLPLHLLAALRRGPDALHAHMPNPSAFALLALPKPSPLIVHWHADVVSSAIDKRVALFYRAYRPFERLLLRRATVILATSPPYLEHSEPLAEFRDKCRVLPLGLDQRRMRRPDPERREALRRRYGPFILALGRFTYYKGFDVLLEAMTHLPEATAVIAGDGETRQRLERRRDELGLANRVHFPGRLNDDDTHDLLDACELFCLPSVERTEAFGLVLLEAMHYAKPLVTTAIPGSGVNFVNQDGETGLVAAMNDPDSLAQALGRLLKDRELRARLGRQARQRLEERFAIDRVRDELEAIYDELGIRNLKKTPPAARGNDSPWTPR